jgi:hypothetical protein
MTNSNTAAEAGNRGEAARNDPDPIERVDQEVLHSTEWG